MSEAEALLPVEPPAPNGILVRGPRGGMLKQGGRHRPAGGRTPSAIKAKCRADFMEVMPLLKEFAKAQQKGPDGKLEPMDIKMADRIRAIDVLGKHGLDAAVTMEDIRDALQQTREILGEHLSRDAADALWNAIIPVWLKL